MKDRERDHNKGKTDGFKVSVGDEFEIHEPFHKTFWGQVLILILAGLALMTPPALLKGVWQKEQYPEQPPAILYCPPQDE